MEGEAVSVISIDQQINEVDRELDLRRREYPELVRRGKMRKAEADWAITRMEAVRMSLLWCRSNADLICQIKSGEVQS